MVGAGALGCELIKAFALMGIGCDGSKGKVTCTDNDTIEVSNLNRQFLFRNSNVGHPKSSTACNAAKVMNGLLNVDPLTIKVGKETEDTLDHDFWQGLDFVVNAVDNVKARMYVDDKCAWHLKPLLESGTLGPRANS
jgi:ubiquitin-activating enzyme E1